MRGKRKDGKPPARGLPGRRKNSLGSPVPGSVGELIYNERRRKQISQQAMAERIAKGTNVKAYNGLISQIELGRRLPSDREVTIIAQMLGLSVPSVRAKRDASPKLPARVKKKALLAPKPTAKLAARTSRPAMLPREAPPEPAAPTAMADWIEMVDSIARMPTDRDLRKRWFACALELLKFRTGGA